MYSNIVTDPLLYVICPYCVRRLFMDSSTKRRTMNLRITSGGANDGDFSKCRIASPVGRKLLVVKGDKM